MRSNLLTTLINDVTGKVNASGVREGFGRISRDADSRFASEAIDPSRTCSVEVRRQIMSYNISTLLLRNLSDVFGENDPVRRRAAIDEIFHEDAVFYDLKGGAFRGRD